MLFNPRGVDYSESVISFADTPDMVVDDDSKDLKVVLKRTLFSERLLEHGHHSHITTWPVSSSPDLTADSLATDLSSEPGFDSAGQQISRLPSSLPLTESPS